MNETINTHRVSGCQRNTEANVSGHPWNSKKDAEKKEQPPESEGLTRALAWVKAGFPVFPCWASDKSPIGRCAPHGYKDATKDEETIRRWWRLYPNALVGVPTGVLYGIIVLDIDLRELKDGFKTLEKLGLHLPKTHVQKTRSDGEHWIYICPEGGMPSVTDILRRLNGGVRTGLDVRANGGYIIAWGYPPEPGSLAEWPAALVEAMEQEERHCVRVVSDVDDRRDYGPADFDVVRQALESIPADDYDDWVGVGMSLHAEFGDKGRDLWDSWSRISAKFDEKKQEKKWRSFHGAERAIGSLFRLAATCGWERRETPAEAAAHIYWKGRADAIIASFFAKAALLRAEADAALQAEAMAAAPEKARYVEPAWCRPIGLIGQIADWIEAGARRPNRPLAIAAAIITIAVITCRHLAGPTGLQAHLYLAILGPTAVGKDYPLRAPGILLRLIGLAAAVTSGKFKSDGAIESVLSDNPCSLAVCDEIGNQLFARMSNKRGSSHETSISGLLRELWGSAFGVHHTGNSKASRSQEILSPALSILGASTLAEFYNTLSSGALENGSLNRWLVIQAAPRAVSRDDAIQSPPPQEICDALLCILPAPIGNLDGGAYALLQRTAPEVHRTPWNDDVRAAFKAFEETTLAAIDDDPELEHYLGRTPELALKLAHVQAIGRAGREAAITMEDWEFGRSLAEDSGRFMATEVSERMSVNEKQANYKMVLKMVKDAGVMSQRDMGRALRGKLGTRELADIIEQLENAGLVSRMRKEQPRGCRSSWIVKIL
jgi:hypothetical protein